VLLIVHRKTVVIEGEKPVGRKQTQKTTIGYVEVEVCYEAREEAAAALDAVAQLEAQTLTLQLFNTVRYPFSSCFIRNSVAEGAFRDHPRVCTGAARDARSSL
jgi:hypothetical protein